MNISPMRRHDCFGESDSLARCTRCLAWYDSVDMFCDLDNKPGTWYCGHCVIMVESSPNPMVPLPMPPFHKIPESRRFAYDIMTPERMHDEIVKLAVDCEMWLNYAYTSDADIYGQHPHPNKIAQAEILAARALEIAYGLPSAS